MNRKVLFNMTSGSQKYVISLIINGQNLIFGHHHVTRKTKRHSMKAINFIYIFSIFLNQFNEQIVSSSLTINQLNSSGK